MNDDETTHTPGEWESGITSAEDRRIAIICGKNGRKLVDIIAEQPISAGEAEANAQLFLAARDLLEAAQKAEDVLSWVEDKPPTAQREEVEALESLRDAIEKAT